jgi:hypothetical protein
MSKERLPQVVRPGGTWRSLNVKIPEPGAIGCGLESRPEASATVNPGESRPLAGPLPRGNANYQQRGYSCSR